MLSYLQFMSSVTVGL